MLKISKLIIVLLFFIIVSGCKKYCNENLRIGEIVQIPISFIGFKVSEINNILVYRINNANTKLIDTFLLSNILWANMASSTSEIITDRKYSKAQSHFGQYDSYLNNCTLIFDWYTNNDTLLNFEIKKSQEKIKGSHENDPNVKIDKLSFIHKGETIFKGESIQISK